MEMSGLILRVVGKNATLCNATRHTMQFVLQLHAKPQFTRPKSSSNTIPCRNATPIRGWHRERKLGRHYHKNTVPPPIPMVFAKTKALSPVYLPGLNARLTVSTSSSPRKERKERRETGPTQQRRVVEVGVEATGWTGQQQQRGLHLRLTFYASTAQPQ